MTGLIHDERLAKRLGLSSRMTKGYPMIEDDLPLSLRGGPRGPDALAGLAREDLDPYSVEDLKERIAGLEAEIRRATEAMERKKNRLSEASALFSFKSS